MLRESNKREQLHEDEEESAYKGGRSDLKNVETTTTHADTLIPASIDPYRQPRDFNIFDPEQMSEYQSSNFAFPKYNTFNKEESKARGEEPRDPSSTTGGDISQKLKEFLKMREYGSEMSKNEERPKTRDIDFQKQRTGGRVQEPHSNGRESTEDSPVSLLDEIKEADPRKPGEMLMVAKYDFRGEKSKDISFSKGDIVRLIDKKKNGWWLGEVGGRIGFVPSNYLGEMGSRSNN
jgi:hypothetical protein